jgi:hypothetical protein
VVLALVGVCASDSESHAVLVVGPFVAVGARVLSHRSARWHGQEEDVVNTGRVVVDELDGRARCDGDTRWIEVQAIHVVSYSRRQVDLRYVSCDGNGRLDGG